MKKIFNSSLFKIEFIILFLCALIITGVFFKTSIINTNKAKSVANVVIDTNDIYSEFIEIGLNKNLVIPLSDSMYSSLSYDWVNFNVRPVYNKFLIGLNMHKWIKNKSDCDDFAKAFTVFLKSEIRKLNPSIESPAIGEIYYIKENNEAHAINILFLYKDNETIISFFDSTEQKFVDLTEKEIKSIYFVTI